MASQGCSASASAPSSAGTRALATVRIVSISCANRALVSSSECSELSRSFDGLMTFTAASTGCADSSSSVR